MSLHNYCGCRVFLFRERVLPDPLGNGLQHTERLLRVANCSMLIMTYRLIFGLEPHRMSSPIAEVVGANYGGLGGF